MTRLNDPGERLREFDDPTREWRRIFSEFWGTLFLVFFSVAASALHAVAPDRVSAAMSAGVSGLIIMAMIYMLGGVGGAHLNPAVTVAFAVRGNFPWRRVPGYLAAQLAGGLLGAALFREIIGSFGKLGATVPGHGISQQMALIIEIVLSAGFVSTILATASGARNVGPNAAIAVGGFRAATELWAMSLTGASMNPIRSFAPDVLRANFQTTWIYLVGPLVGALIAVGAEWLLIGPPTKSGSEEAQGDGGSSRTRNP